MVVAILMVGLVGICWMTYCLLPESKRHWSLLPLAVAFGVVALGATCLEVFTAWVMLSALPGNATASATVVLLIHAVALLAVWRSSR